MRASFIAAVALLCLVAAASPAAHAQSATPVPDMKPDFSSMMFLIGRWTCHTKVPDRPNERVQLTTYALALDGRFIHAHGDSPPFDPARTRPFIADGYITYDAIKRRWIYFDANNFGGYGVGTSLGWTGNTMTWTDLLTSGNNPYGSVTITKTSDTRTDEVGTILTPTGVQHFTQYCVKS